MGAAVVAAHDETPYLRARENRMAKAGSRITRIIAASIVALSTATAVASATFSTPHGASHATLAADGAPGTNGWG